MLLLTVEEDIMNQDQSTHDLDRSSSMSVSPGIVAPRDESNSVDFYRFIINSMPLAVVTMDSEFRITGFNPRAEVLTGYTAQEALGKPCREILRSTLCGDPCPLRAIQNRKTSLVSSPAEFRNREGRTVSVRVSAAALFDGEGQRIGGVETIMDISHIVTMERERANFISMLAHDMRSSLTGIHGLGLRLLRGPSEMDEVKARKYMEIITKEAAKLESLVDDFLDLSRMEMGGFKLNTAAVSLDKELEEIFETYREKAAQQGSRLELHVSDVLPVIEADAHRLRRVFTNLIDNALKFSKDNGVVVITTRETDTEVMVAVEDSGVGIDPADLPFIFDIFHRGRRVGGREGHGLGLATVRVIVEGHHGRIQVASEPNVGTTFTVYLPKQHRGRGIEGE
jgi:PAS domain S-box-containing protein